MHTLVSLLDNIDIVNDTVVRFVLFINFGMECKYSILEKIYDTFVKYVHTYLEVSYEHVNRTINNQK